MRSSTKHNRLNFRKIGTIVGYAATNYDNPSQLALVNYLSHHKCTCDIIDMVIQLQSFASIYNGQLSNTTISTLYQLMNNTKVGITWMSTAGQIISTWLQKTTNSTIPIATAMAPPAPAAPASPVPPAAPAPTPLSTRLPSNLSPLQYYLTLQPYIPSIAGMPPGRNFTFDANISIIFNVSKPTRNIVLNVWNLNVLNGSIVVGGGTPHIGVVNTTTNTTLQQLSILVDSTLTVGAFYTLKMQYTGLINDYIGRGLFRTSYVDKSGHTQ